LIRAERKMRKFPVSPHISPYFPYFRSLRVSV
jgi:hypothetical protein